MESIDQSVVKKVSEWPNLLGKADLHIHSEHSSDSFVSIRSILKAAEEKGLDLIAITDHDKIGGAVEAQKISSEFKVKTIIGEEVGAKEGHLISIFIKERIAPQRPILDTIKEVHSQGGLAIVAHPSNLFYRGVKLKTLMKIYRELDGIELFNANAVWTAWATNKKIIKLNSEVFKLAAIGSSDAHIISQIGMGYTIFNGKEPDDLYSSIKNKATQAKRDSDFSVYSWLLANSVNQPRRIIKKLFG